MRLVGLSLGLEQHGRFLGEGRADDMRTSRDRHANREVLVDAVLRRQIAVQDAWRPSSRFDREEPDAVSVHEQLEVVRLAQAFHLLVTIPCQPDGDVCTRHREERCS